MMPPLSIAPPSPSPRSLKVRDVMQARVVAIRDEDSVALAQQLMLWNGIRHLPVLRASDRRLVGIVSERDVLRGLRAPDAVAAQMLVRDLMSSPVEHIHPKADLADAAADLGTKRIGCLPVVDAGELVGMLAVSDVLAVVAQSPVPKRQPRDGESVASIMFPEPIAVHVDDRLVMTAQRMAQSAQRHACVVDGEGVLIGIVSDRDVRRVLGDPRRALDERGLPKGVKEMRIGAAMTRDPRALSQDDSIRHALDMLLASGFGALPVTDDRGRLRGIVSYIDVLQHFAERDGSA